MQRVPHRGSRKGMKFADQLLGLVEYAESTGKERLDSRLRSFVATVVDGLKADWGEFERQELIEDAEEAGEAAIWLDAVHCARKLGMTGAKVADIPLAGGSTAGNAQASIAQLFESKALPKKGFVYVLWTASPEEYGFVGTAGSLSECKFSPKSSAGKALADAETLSLIVPARGGKKQLSELSSSIIHLTRCKLDADPTHNDDVDADMPDSPAWKPIQQLSDLLEDAGVLLFNRAQTGED